MRWLTLSVPGDPGRHVLLEKPGAPAHDDATAEQASELMTKGAMGLALIPTTDDSPTTYDALVARGVQFTQEPTEQSYGIDCALRDPFGNHIRIGQMAPAAQ